MESEIRHKVVHALNGLIEPLSDSECQYASLLNKIGDSRIVLIGEASMGPMILSGPC